jgi:hypothetical protein
MFYEVLNVAIDPTPLNSDLKPTISRDRAAWHL